MKYIVKKFITLIITLLVVSLLAFLAFQIISGDPAVAKLGTGATPEALAALRHKMGLDRPVYIRYLEWVWNFLHWDMGTSYSYSMPVSRMLADKLPVTFALTLISFVFMVVLSIPLGITAAKHRGGVFDRIITVADQVVMSVPSFFIGIVFCYLFGILFRLFIPGEFVDFSVSPAGFLGYLIFPALSIAIPRVAMTVKMLRSAIIEETGKDYVRTAYSRGNSPSMALRRHVLKNALIPTITFIAVSMAEIVAGSIIIEQVFTIPGIGRLLLSSISNRDYPVVQAIVVLIACWVVFVNFAADILYQLADPRIRLK
ncbi:MAG: ABC transporter permease [Oscillospiraceae bacterium]|nr:ABC transporter permease [Oscillospiraceae bacterium]